MRYLFIWLMIISLGSFASAQDARQAEIPIRDFFPTIYKNKSELKSIFDEVAEKLKISSDLKVYILYYKGQKVNKLNFNSFKSKVEKILVKSNKIEAEKVSIINSDEHYYSSNSFKIWVVDNDGKPVSRLKNALSEII
jgi:hypothetical protein